MEKLCGHCARYIQHYILLEEEYKPVLYGHCMRDKLRLHPKTTDFGRSRAPNGNQNRNCIMNSVLTAKKCYNSSMEPLLKRCRLCPHACGADRTAGEKGKCGAGAQLKVARAALHFWEEPCISGAVGSGTVFFSHCPLHCVYCQNAGISSGKAGAGITTGRLADIFLELQEQGAANINLVTPTHYVPHIIEALARAKERGLTLPIVYNCSGYEGVEALRLLAGMVDIYLMDFKYMDASIARRYSHAAGYPLAAKRALREMVRQAGDAEFDEKGLMRRGVIVRHLLLPGCLEDSRAVVRYLYETYGNRIWLSLMSQYTPVCKERLPEELRRQVRAEEYDALVDFAVSLGIENGFIQEGKAADESFIPPFDLTGIFPG
ncbi:radical SAM protein [Christensenella tenuis]|jgi:putative pyruvate formate lyase activating enzyme